MSKRTATAMGKYWPMLLAGAVVSATAWPQLSSALDGATGTRIMLAQQEDPKKKKEQGKPKPAPKQGQPQQQPQQQPKLAPKQVQPQQQPKPAPKQVQPQEQP